MERLKDMSLRKSFFLLTLCGLLAAVVLAAGLWAGCAALSSRYPLGGVSIGSDGMITPLPGPKPEQMRLLRVLGVVALLGWILLPAAGLAVAGTLFYRWKLKEPIRILSEGTGRIRAHDLDFTIPAVSGDELGQVCEAFETMRAELLKTNREIWRQMEERKRLNAAFAHDLRNPITVLKGNLKLLRQGKADEGTLERLESYTARLERYVEAMSSIQRLEQMPVKRVRTSYADMKRTLEETTRLLTPGLEVSLRAEGEGTLWLDHDIFLAVAENLMENAARYARREIKVSLAVEDDRLSLHVADDGPGFPAELCREGPKPFGKTDTGGEHFGMGLYSCTLLCAKHGGALRLENREGGAMAAATFKIGGEA